MNETIPRTALLDCGQVAALSSGRVAVAGNREIRSVVIDSRQARRDCLFVALPGARVDGHRFVAEAVERGASAVLAASARWSERREEWEGLLRKRSAGLVVVEDTLSALGRLAKGYLARYSGLVTIGVTGSNGKTTTKEIIGSILSLDAPSLTSEGNLNSEIGLPLSCLRVRPEHRFGVFEMGVNHPGEMSVLADILRPQLAVITNIGSAHVGILGSREGIAREKKNIFTYFTGCETAFLYEGEEFYRYLADGLRGTVVPFGPKSTKGYEGSEDLGLDGTIINWEGLRIRFPLFGPHNLRNALASISVSAELGVEKSTIKKGLERVRPLSGRSRILRGRVTVVEDCYNANPDSFAELFAFVSSLPWEGRKVAVIGSMKELGEQSEEAHRRVGRQAVAAGFDALLFFGAETEVSYHSARRSMAAGGGSPPAVEWTTDFHSLSQRLASRLKPGDLVAVKGSRAMELERLSERMLEE